ncbi:DeoR/GlpR family DNA-binding transcription regulator [Segeticoccus rhizosphaerae]|jgi:DeoR/GlpR family transcriptional regulator of sugar metabolism|uniref:DeoR/GlpR family DNA-binding transcription regulator n=1 Tax=Segeticoccus rhizosphaerae TaxID=1104777 RepID=UPI0010C080C3|nr:DeoR/GlpR family DNA-binding transcription regulator [Ornithinicoccus soli]
MLPVQRRAETIGLLTRRGVVSVEDLAAQLDVSLSTIRRDLDELERQGIVRRVHGGAVLHTEGEDAPEKPPAMREVERQREKQEIARRAVQLIEPGSAVLLSGGTTTAALAPLLAEVEGISVVTNSLAVAMQMADLQTDVIVLGGVLRRPELSLLGTLVGIGLEELHLDHAIMGVYGVDPRSCLLGASAQESQTDRLVAHSADRLTVLADSSKFSRRSPHRIATLETVSELVTSSQAAEEHVQTLRDQGLVVHVA